MYSREKGLKYLGSEWYHKNDIVGIENYIDEASDEDFLDFLDFVFSNFICDTKLKKDTQAYFRFETDPFQSAVDELNLRFTQHGLGYECINGEIIPKTNAVIHQTVIKPALKLLTDERFRGAEEEYLAAFECLRRGDNKDAILNAEKAFESTIKVICNLLGFDYKDDDSAKRLVETLKKNGFFPSYLNTYIDRLCAMLEEGAPVIRNKESGHGQGAEIKATANEYVEYVLNTVASDIVFMYRLFTRHCK